MIPGQLSISSTPKERSSGRWPSQRDLADAVRSGGPDSGAASGQREQGGYATENRTIEVGSGSKSFLVVELAPLGATALVSSVPSGAEVFMDGRDTGRATPAQEAVYKLFTNNFTDRKEGYLEETTTTTLQAGQSFQYAPVLRALGITEDIKARKFKKMFGGGDTAGMGSVAVKTQPKGAQIAVNRHVLDKGSPADFYLNPGTYIVDITLSGYKNVHKIITVERGSSKSAIDEVLERQ